MLSVFGQQRIKTLVLEGGWDELNDISVAKSRHKLFLAVLDGSELVLWEHFEGIVGFATRRIHFVNAEFALAELFCDVKRFRRSGRMIKDDRQLHEMLRGLRERGEKKSVTVFC